MQAGKRPHPNLRSMNAQQAVLVTGASTGIGYASALLLARSGYAVFAGVRKPDDAQRLELQHANIRPLTLDVTEREQIGAAAGAIAASGVPLRAVVNNAGIAVAGPLEFLPLEEFRRQFEVNVFGSLAVTQAVLPLLRRANGRIVFMSSVSGQIAPPYVGPYASSKFALEAMADAMRMELAQFGVTVSVIQPGNVNTPIWAKGRAGKDELVAQLPAEVLGYYGEAIETLVRVTEHEERHGIAPETVAGAVLKAVTARNPRARYAVGNPAGWQRRIAALLPERLRDRLVLKNFRR